MARISRGSPTQADSGLGVSPKKVLGTHAESPKLKKLTIVAPLKKIPEDATHIAKYDIKHACSCMRNYKRNNSHTC